MVSGYCRCDLSEPELLKNSHEPYAVIASGDGIYKLDYNKVLSIISQSEQMLPLYVLHARIRARLRDLVFFA